MKASKLLNNIGWILQVGAFLLFILAGYSIYSVLATTAPEGTQIQIQADPSSGFATISLRLIPNNSGPLAVKLRLILAFEDSTGSTVSTVSETIDLDPGNKKVVNLTLNISLTDLRGFSNADGSSLRLITDIRTLIYIGLANDVRIRGGTSK